MHYYFFFSQLFTIIHQVPSSLFHAFFSLKDHLLSVYFIETPYIVKERSKSLLNALKVSYEMICETWKANLLWFESASLLYFREKKMKSYLIKNYNSPCVLENQEPNNRIYSSQQQCAVPDQFLKSQSRCRNASLFRSSGSFFCQQNCDILLMSHSKVALKEFQSCHVQLKVSALLCIVEKVPKTVSTTLAWVPDARTKDLRTQNTTDTVLSTTRHQSITIHHDSVLPDSSTTASTSHLSYVKSSRTTSLLVPPLPFSMQYLKVFQTVYNQLMSKEKSSTEHSGKKTFFQYVHSTFFGYDPETNLETHVYNNSEKNIPTFPLICTGLLYITELPILILWIYSAYWIVIVCMTRQYGCRTIWFSAVSASFLVGLGLNANAYKSVTLWRQRYLAVIEKQFNGCLPYGIKQTSFMDWGTVIRFFIIPFGVSSMSGLTHAARQDFLLVFPKDPVNLIIALLCPTLIASLLFLVRLYVLKYLHISNSLHVFFFNDVLPPYPVSHVAI